MENEMSYAERVTTIPRPDGHCGALYEEGHQTARRAAAAIAAEADADIARLRAAQGWQPIETAPKSGADILIYAGEYGDAMKVISWRSPWGNWGWYTALGEYVTPTHWMPLPAAPDAPA
jgi:hypothetical protein